MARTHGASSRFHQDDGVVLGKGGVPIPVTPVRGVPTMYPHAAPAPAVSPEPAAPAQPAPAPEYEWFCDRTTWGRNMDGWQALQLLSVMLGGLSATLTEEQFRQLPPDARWHFKRRAVAVKAAAE